MTDLVPVPTGAPGGVVYNGVVRSVHWDRLARLSDRLVESIGSHPVDTRTDGRWYVPRGVEPTVLERLTAPGGQPQIVIGEAGHGKSTLLWSLHRELRLRGHRPLVISATWLQHDENGSRTTSTDDIADAIIAEPGTVLLLDTADLLLHNESTRLDVIDLLDRLSRAAVPVVATTRPQESAYLPSSAGHKIYLGPYSIERELPSAISALTEEFCTDDSAMPTDPLSTIMSARVRGLLVDEVCTSPLLLRLLFSLSAPQFPRLELDVSGLYSRFWARRVMADHRTGPETPIDGGDDLARATGFLGIAMLALGTPEPHIDDLIRRAAEVAVKSGHPTGEDVLRSDIRTLTGRGVLISVDDRVRFFHQTFFEFAAAKGLSARGGDMELPRLIERIVSAPDDLFVGAVVEQTLIMLGTDALAHPTVAAGCQTLLDTGHSHSISLALTVWAHHPTTVRFSDQELASITDEHMRRFLRTLSRVHSPTAAVVQHLSALWISRPTLRTAITTTADSLAGRDPDSIAALVRSTDMYTELVASHDLYVRSNSEPRTLLQLLAPTQPIVVREAILATIDGLAAPTTAPDKNQVRNRGKQTIARYLHLAAEVWSHIGDDSFHRALAQTVVAIQARDGDSDADTVRDAYAVVIATDLEARVFAAHDGAVSWLAWIEEVLTALERAGGDRDPVVAARLIALGATIGRLRSPDDDDIIADTYSKMFALSGRAAPRQLARGALARILATDSPARLALTPILAAMLDGRLPAEHNGSVPGDELWAAVARQTLWDSTIDLDVMQAILEPTLRTYAGDEQLFTTGNHIVALAPAAIVWGEPAAVEAAHALNRIDVRVKRDKQAANIFLDRAVERAHQNPDLLVPLTVAIARTVGRTTAVTALLSESHNRHALDRAAPLLQDWLADLLTGDDKEQNEGAELLRQLTEHGITTPTFGQLESWLDRSTSPKGIAKLLITISAFAQQSETTGEAVALFEQFVTTAATPHPSIAPFGRSTQPEVAEAARRGLLECIAAHPDMSLDQWRTVHTLTFAPRLHGKLIDVAGIRHLALFVEHKAVAGRIDDAIAHLAEICTTLAPMDKNLRIKASNRMKKAVAAILRRAKDRHYDALAHLVRTAPEQTSKQLAHGLLDSPLFAARAREFVSTLDITPRVVGIGPFPEILAPAAPPAEPSADTPENDTFGASASTGAPTPDSLAQRAAEVLLTLAARKRELQESTHAAYYAIREHTGATNDAAAARNFSKTTGFPINEQMVYRLKSGKHWRAPSHRLCAAIDKYGAALGAQFELTARLNNFTTAKQADDDLRNARH